MQIRDSNETNHFARNNHNQPNLRLRTNSLEKSSQPANLPMAMKFLTFVNVFFLNLSYIFKNLKNQTKRVCFYKIWD